MSWRVVVRPEVADDITEAADRYDSREEGLGDRFIGEVLEEFTNPKRMQISTPVIGSLAPVPAEEG